MKGWTSAAGNVNIRQPQRATYPTQKSKGSSIPAGCDHKANSKGQLCQHKRAVHEGVKYPCRQCDHKATSKGHLTRHSRAAHERVKYSCTLCSYQASRKNLVNEHTKKVHIEKQCSKGEIMQAIYATTAWVCCQLDCSPSLPTSQVKLRLEAAMSTTGFAKFSCCLRVPIIEQQIGGHISTVTGQNSVKHWRLDG